MTTQLELLIEEKRVRGDQLFEQYAMYCWYVCLSKALGGTVQDERVKPDFNRCRPALHVNSVSLLMLFHENSVEGRVSSDTLQELTKERIEEVLHDELDTHNVKLVWGWRADHARSDEPRVLLIAPADQ